ncbi:PepSY domain-containing protein [Steroidobacter cummioxidans]|uniref:PepSY domain-containing protein n=1 Tax=Steroidobacter cummioxidans TaxID=1803913 RepID=UPI000E31B53A|nr:PepSY domain-containing protein [Steroidobacter cummioxidans]
MTIETNGVRALMLAAVVAMMGVAGASAWAQSSAPEQVVKVPANALSIADIESRLGAQGIKVKEIKLRDLIAKVEGYDAQGREIEMVIDRRSGETLSHEYDDDDRKGKRK